jgi:phage host-nuclease inhibitor protein Gam
MQIKFRKLFQSLINLKANSMDTLTAQEVTQLANNFLSLELIIGNYKSEKSDDLTKSQRTKLSDFQWTLLNYSDDLFALSTVLVMVNAKNELAKISETTEKIKATVTKIEKFQKVINIAAAVVTLGAAIFSKNPIVIAQSINDLISVVNA